MVMDKLYCGILLSILLLSTFTMETQAAKCCLGYTKSSVRCVHLKGFTIQKNTRQCDLSAIIFQTINGKHFCANPIMHWTQDRVRCLMEKAKSVKNSSVYGSI